MEVYKVAGGWHASIPEMWITVFGLTETEAVLKLEESRKRSLKLLALAAAKRGEKP
jgi:hypothetical protein